jgi:hypothetical protein
VGAVPELLKRFAVRQGVMTHHRSSERRLAPLRPWFDSHGIPVLRAASMLAAELEPGLTVRVLFDGAHGSGLRVDYGNYSLLSDAPPNAALERRTGAQLAIARPSAPAPVGQFTTLCTRTRYPCVRRNRRPSHRPDTPRPTIAHQ